MGDAVQLFDCTQNELQNDMTEKNPCGGRQEQKSGPFSSAHELCEPEKVSKPLWASSGSLGLGCFVCKPETSLTTCRRLNVEKINIEEILENPGHEAHHVPPNS